MYRPSDLARVVWEPAALDVLVAHDLAMQHLVFPAAVTGRLPWIGTLRVARLAGEMSFRTGRAKPLQ